MNDAVEHLGEMVCPRKYGFRLGRQDYAIINKKPSLRMPRHLVPDEWWEAMAWRYEDDEHTVYTDEWCQQQREQSLENFDLNMAFFAQLDEGAFEAALAERMSRVRGLREVHDLRTLHDVTGVYVMVLGEYRQAYVGQSLDMRQRIKKHWAGTKVFDRLLWGDVTESVLAIDSFRALDTTRVLAVRTDNQDAVERRLVNTIPPDFLLNRIGGGRMTGLRAAFIAAEVKRRQLVQPALG